jgi:hypothetical protein
MLSRLYRFWVGSIIGLGFSFAEPSGLLQAHIVGNGLISNRQELLLNTKQITQKKAKTPMDELTKYLQQTAIPVHENALK